MYMPKGSLPIPLELTVKLTRPPYMKKLLAWLSAKKQKNFHHRISGKSYSPSPAIPARYKLPRVFNRSHPNLPHLSSLPVVGVRYRLNVNLEWQWHGRSYLHIGSG